MIHQINSRLKSFVASQPAWFFICYTSLSAFFTYSCMYAFRKPFTAAEYHGFSLWGVDYKIWMITAQVVGYTLSKFIGIRFVSEIKQANRALWILLLVGVAELSLLLVYLIPFPYSFVFMFFNGLPLGIIWGLVFSYLEGRTLTELLGAILSVSFIVASGIVKSVGKYLLLHYHISEFSMPFFTGALFVIPLLLSVFLLDNTPPPTPTDVSLRTKREPMNKIQRKAFVKEFFWAMVFMVTAYVFLTIFREIRDNFAFEIWKGLGKENDPAIFTMAELPVAVFTLVVLSLVVLIHSNIKALQTILWIVLSGFIVIIAASVLFSIGYINGTTWMILIGVGTYLGYIPFNAFLYERMISAFRCAGNVGFVMYISDAFGYLGSLSVVFCKNFFSPSISWISFFIRLSCWISIAGIILIVLSILYFTKKYHLSSNHQNLNHDNIKRIITRKPLFAFNSRTPVNQ